jgi:hypothetical protein
MSNMILSCWDNDETKRPDFSDNIQKLEEFRFSIGIITS